MQIPSTAQRPLTACGSSADACMRLAVIEHEMWKRLCMRACPQLARTHADISTEVRSVCFHPATSTFPLNGWILPCCKAQAGLCCRTW